MCIYPHAYTLHISPGPERLHAGLSDVPHRYLTDTALTLPTYQTSNAVLLNFANSASPVTVSAGWKVRSRISLVYHKLGSDSFNARRYFEVRANTTSGAHPTTHDISNDVQTLSEFLVTIANTASYPTQALRMFSIAIAHLNTVSRP